MAKNWDEEQAHLEQRVRGVCKQLALDTELSHLGSIALVGSAALHVMVARDIDLTVTVSELNPNTLLAVAKLAARLSARPDVREVTFRNDTGRWNTDPDYPDGLYLHVKCTDESNDLWTLDIWFVDQPERQPDLQHVASIGPLITPQAQATILAIKRSTCGLRADGTRLPSFEIYHAVLVDGVRSLEEFRSDR